MFHTNTLNDIREIEEEWKCNTDPERVKLSTEMAEAFRRFNLQKSAYNTEVVRFNLLKIFKHFVEKTLQTDLFIVYHFTKDSSGLVIEYLPGLIMDKIVYRLKVFLQADPENPDRTICYVCTRRHDEQESDESEEVHYSNNYPCSHIHHRFRVEMQSKDMTNLSLIDFYIAGTFAREVLMERVMLLTYLHTELDAWHYVCL